MRFVLLFILCPILIWAETKILILGDSNTHGLPTKEFSWVTILKEEYKDKPWIKFYNYGLGMATVEQCEMLYHIAHEIHDPDIVIYTAGLVNVIFKQDLDKHMGPSMGRTLQKCIDNKCYVLFGMIDFSCFCRTFKFDKGYIDKANGIYGILANTFYDYITPFVFLEEELLTNPTYNIGDNLHPNLEGQKIIAMRVKHALEQVLYLPFDIIRELRNNEFLRE